MTDSPSDDPGLTNNRAIVIGAILVTALLAASVVALLIYRSMYGPEPSRVLVVRTSPSWEGGKLTLNGESLRAPMSNPIERYGNFTVPFFVWPGEYTLRVDPPPGVAADIEPQHIDLRFERSVEIDLRDHHATSAPATAPSTSPAPASATATTLATLPTTLP